MRLSVAGLFGLTVFLAACAPDGLTGKPESPFVVSPTANVDVAPALPTDFRVVVYNGHIDLSWENAEGQVNTGDPQDFIRVHRRIDPNTGVFGTTHTVLPLLPLEAESFSDTSIVAGYSYQYRVRPCLNQTLCSDWTEWIVVAAEAPEIPTGLTSTYVGGDANLDWSLVLSGEMNVQVSRRVDPGVGSFGPTAIVATLAPGSEEYTDPDLVVGHRYQYRVRACNGYGCSPYSAWSTVIAQVPPSTPTGFVANWAAGMTTLGWTNTGAATTSVQVNRRIDPGVGSFGPSSRIATLEGPATSYQSVALNSGHRYQYRVRSCNAVGCSPYTAWRTIVVP